MASLLHYASFFRRKPALLASATRARVIRIHNIHNETLIRLTTLTHDLSNRANIRSSICGARMKLEWRDTDHLIACQGYKYRKTILHIGVIVINTGNKYRK